MKDYAKYVLNFAAKNLKDRMNANPKQDRDKHAETVIRHHVLLTMGAGFIPFPVLDILAVTAVQLDMVKQLCQVYDVDYSGMQGKAIVGALTSSTLTRTAARGMLKIIPGVGTVIGGVALTITTGASTYALGETFKQHFKNGGTVLDIDTTQLKKAYAEQFEKGKKIAEKLRKKQEQEQKAELEELENIDLENVALEDEPDTPVDPTVDPPQAPPTVLADDLVEMPTPKPNTKSGRSGKEILEDLQQLTNLKESGALNEAEYEKMKRKLLEEF